MIYYRPGSAFLAQYRSLTLDKEMVESKQTNIVKPILLILFIFFSLVSCSPDGGPGTVQTPGGGETPGSNSTVCPPGSVCPTVPADSTSSPLTNTMAFSEEFDGDSLPSLFWPLPIWFDHPGVTDENAEAQAIWTADSVSVSGGYLHLQATRLDAPEQGRQYASGYAQPGDTSTIHPFPAGGSSTATSKRLSICPTLQAPGQLSGCGQTRNRRRKLISWRS